VSISSHSSRHLQAQVPTRAQGLVEQAGTAADSIPGVSSLTDAVLGSQVISQAVGIVMERFELSSTRAIEYLVRTSQASQRRLRFVAAELVARANERDEPGRQA
jgi:hypothetical protein